MTRFSFYLLVALIGAPLAARADAISPPPTDCVDGSMGVLCHGPPRCGPVDCGVDASCGPGQVCRATPLCIETVSCGGITTTMDPNVTGQCLTGHCAVGGTCETRMVCVTSTSAADDGLDMANAPDLPSSDMATATDMPASTDMNASTDMPSSIDAPAGDSGTTIRGGGGCCSTAGARGAAGGAIAGLGLVALVVARRRGARLAHR